MHLITYDIELLEPVLVTALDGDPNSSVSYDFIPGSVLRGAFIGRYQSRHGSIDISAVKPLFFSPETQFLNGYRTIYDEDSLETVQSWPLPLSLRREEKKVEDETSFQVYDFAFAAAEDVERLKGFGILTSQSQKAKIDRQVSIHIQRDRHLGRSTRASGEIYNYEALSPRQTFRAHILTTLAKTEIQPVVDLLTGEMQIGGSRSAGYGRVRLTPVADALPLEQWLAKRTGSKNGSKPLVITLLSDLLVRDEQGQWTTDLCHLADMLGITLKMGFPAFRPIGAFNRKWGLPLPQRIAFQMGTVLVCEPPTEEQWQQLTKFVRDGIGESREDGFGRIALNWQRQPQFTMFKLDPPEPELVPLAAGSKSQVLAQTMAERIWRSQLDAAVVAEANHLAKKRPRLSKSQLYRLRLKVQATLQTVRLIQQTAVNPENLISDVYNDNLRLFMKDLQRRRSTREQFNKARVGKQKLLDWITALLKHTPDTITGSEPFNRVTPVSIGNVSSRWTDILVLEYNLRLIDAVLATIAKKSKQQEGSHAE